MNLPFSAVNTTCPYCGVGCGVRAMRLPDGNVTIEGDNEHPANFGRLCSKGSALAETIDLEGRLLYPTIAGRRSNWDQALNLIAEKFRATIAEYGPDSVAFYVSGQILTEDYYVANKLMKGYIGSANIDTNSRLCMASSVAGHRRAFGTDTVPGTYEDLELADLIVLVGSNLAWCHPVLYQRISAAKAKRPQMKVVLIDPRRTNSADIADLHLPIAADGDAMLFCGLLAHLASDVHINNEWVAKHTNGFDAALAAAQRLSIHDIAAHTGLTAHEIQKFYAMWSRTEKVVTVFSQGVNQSSVGSDKVNAIINCHLATARIGRPGMGPFSVTGQPNAMGGREVGGLANMLAAHMDIENPAHRDCVQRFWQSPAIASKPGLKAVDMFDAVADGRIKALWIMATNPVDSLPNADAVQTAIKACPLVIASDVLAQTDTIRHAHIALPSLAWGEKDGTVTNSERRISRQRAFLPMPGQARADWWQMAQVGQRMGFKNAFDWPNAAAVFREYAALTTFENNGKRDLDIGAMVSISDAKFEQLPPFQWPKLIGAKTDDLRFFAEGGFYTSDKKARFITIDPQPPVRTSRAYPLVLNTGRIRDHWHTMTRTGKSQQLSGHIAEPFVEIHPLDAAVLNIEIASIVQLSSEFGEVKLRALITDRQQRGSVFVPMHWNDQFASAARIDTLLAPIVDPISGQPALKHGAVNASIYPAKTYGFAVGLNRPTADIFGYWSIAKTAAGWRLECADQCVLDDNDEQLVDRTAKMFSVDINQNFQHLIYRDTASGEARIALFEHDQLIATFFSAPQPVNVARGWLIEQLGESFTDTTSRWQLLSGRPSTAQPDKGALICSCMSVGINQIISAVASGCSTVEAVGQCTGAGTNCGSCKAEIKGIVHVHRPIDIALVTAA